MLKRNPQMITFKGENYKRVAPTAAPQTVTYQGGSYHLAGLPEQEVPTAPIEVSADPIPQEAPPKVGLDVEVISDEDSHPWRNQGKKPGRKKQEKGLPSLNPEENTPLIESVDYDIYVRLSQDDFLLLSSLEEAAIGLLNDFLTRARSKKLTSGRAEVLASEEEVREAISALQSFISADDSPEATMLHAQDMLSSWKRNYLIPDTPTSRTPPSYTNDLPRGTTIRTFSYKGARYILVEGAEEEAPEKSAGQKFLEMIRGEEFSEIFYKIPKAILQGSPMAQLRELIDKMEQGRQAVDKAFMRLNNKETSLRMAVDALYKTDQNEENLARLVTEDNLLQDLTNEFIAGLAEYGAATESAQVAYKAAKEYVVSRGWTSNWAAKQDKAKRKKQILTDLFGVDDAAAFVQKYYHPPGPETRSKKEQQDKAEG